MTHIITIRMYAGDPELGIVESEQTTMLDPETTLCGSVQQGFRTPLGPKTFEVVFDPPLLTRVAIRQMGGEFMDEKRADEEADETGGG